MSLTCVAGLKFKMSIFLIQLVSFQFWFVFVHFFTTFFEVAAFRIIPICGSRVVILPLCQWNNVTLLKKISKSSSYVKENAIRKPEYLKSDWMERLQLCSFHFPFPQWLLCTIKTILIQNEQTVNRDSHWKPHKCQDGICTYEIQTSSKPVILHSRLFLWACRRWGSCMAVTEMRCK